MADIYKSIYEKINLLVNGLPEFMRTKGYLKLKSAGFMDLTIEKIAQNRIALTHYYELNGDLVPDPEITVKIHLDKGLAEADTYQDTYSYQEIYPEEGKVNLKLKKDINSFLSQWLDNLKVQGFYS